MLPNLLLPLSWSSSIFEGLRFFGGTADFLDPEGTGGATSTESTGSSFMGKTTLAAFGAFFSFVTFVSMEKMKNFQCVIFTFHIRLSRVAAPELFFVLCQEPVP
jgi:hypothetical protein